MAKRENNTGSIFRRKDGRWVAALNLGYVNGKLKRKCFYGKTAEAVGVKLEQAKTDAANGMPMLGSANELQRFRSTRGFCFRDLREDRDGYLYLLVPKTGTAAFRGVVKIGKANNVQRRLSQVQTGSPWRLDLLQSWWVPDVVILEKRLHSILAPFRMRDDGEWFDLPPDWLRVIRDWTTNELLAFCNARPSAAIGVLCHGGTQNYSQSDCMSVAFDAPAEMGILDRSLPMMKGQVEHGLERVLGSTGLGRLTKQGYK